MRVLTVAGVDIIISPLFLVAALLCWITGIAGDAAVLFLCVFLHEVCHCLVAHMLGLRVRSIEILPIGGAATVEGIGGLEPACEFSVAIVGPLLNVTLAMGAVFLHEYCGLFYDVSSFTAINLTLAFSNLIPAYPLDGGRCVHALLSVFLGESRSSKIVIRATLLMALGALVYGTALLFEHVVHPTAFVMAVFLGVAAWREKQNASFARLEAANVKNARLRNGKPLRVKHIAVDKSVTLGAMIRMMSAGSYYRVSVLDRSKAIAQFDDAELYEAFIEHGANATLSQIAFKPQSRARLA